jgi:hypothetical protein
MGGVGLWAVRVFGTGCVEPSHFVNGELLFLPLLMYKLKASFHQHVDYLFCVATRLLSFIWTITFPFSSLDSLMMIYSSLVN